MCLLLQSLLAHGTTPPPPAKVADPSAFVAPPALRHRASLAMTPGCALCACRVLPPELSSRSAARGICLFVWAAPFVLTCPPWWEGAVFDFSVVVAGLQTRAFELWVPHPRFVKVRFLTFPSSVLFTSFAAHRPYRRPVLGTQRNISFVKWLGKNWARSTYLSQRRPQPRLLISLLLKPRTAST